MQAIVGLGSNVGNKERHLLDAARSLEALPEIVPIALSSAYETAPVGPPQPRYLNAALRLETTWSPEALLAALHGVEAALGRRRGPLRWGPRIIDLDLLLAEDRITRGPRPALPHPRLAERPFALVPMLEIHPDAIDPVSGARYEAILSALDSSDVTRSGPLPSRIPRLDVDHTADRAFVVEGETLAALNENAVMALLDVMFDRRALVERERRVIEAGGDDPSERLVAILGELPYLLDAERFAACRATLLHIDDETVRVVLHGETLRNDAQVTTAVKAVTHHGDDLARDARGRWRATVVVDV